jgi:calcineurin-like phosphoesterase
LLFLGDLVGRSGRTAVWNRLPGLIRDFKLDFVIVNGENAAGGFGITEEIFLETLNAGADVVTTGNHVWDQREALVLPTGTSGSSARRTIPPERRDGAPISTSPAMAPG